MVYSEGMTKHTITITAEFEGTLTAEEASALAAEVLAQFADSTDHPDAVASPSIHIGTATGRVLEWANA